MEELEKNKDTAINKGCTTDAQQSAEDSAQEVLKNASDAVWENDSDAVSEDGTDAVLKDASAQTVINEELSIAAATEGDIFGADVSVLPRDIEKKTENKKEKPSLKQKIKNDFKKIYWKNFIFLTVAGIINAVGVTMFLTPVSLYDGGLSGTSFLLSQLTPLSMSIYLLILNVPFFLFGFKKMGLPFILYSLYTIGIYSLFAFLFQNKFGIDMSNGSPVVGNEIILCSIFGGIISGVGSGITIRFGGAIDGVEVAAVVCAKRLGITVGTFVMIYNVIIYVIAGIVMNNWTLALYSIVTYAAGLKAVDFVVEGFDKAKSAFIITNNSDAVAAALSEEFGRGITVMDAEGFYSKTSKKIIYCVVNRFEVGKLKSIVSKTDPTSFVAISEVSDSLGSSVRYRRHIKAKTK